MTSIIDIYEAWGEAIKADETGRWEKIEDVLDVTGKVMEVFPHTHRASDDAIQLAASFKILVEPEWDYISARNNFLPIGSIV
jgi:phosphoribosylformylglycinamidine (FGAM) synthase-like amidotransferase family enzyme